MHLFDVDGYLLWVHESRSPIVEDLLNGVWTAIGDHVSHDVCVSAQPMRELYNRNIVSNKPVFVCIAASLAGGAEFRHRRHVAADAYSAPADIVRILADDCPRQIFKGHALPTLAINSCFKNFSTEVPVRQLSAMAQQMATMLSQSNVAHGFNKSKHC